MDMKRSTAIRNLPDCPDGKKIPIIAMTANAFAEDVQAALNAGMDDHVAKPIDMSILISVITKYRTMIHLMKNCIEGNTRFRFQALTNIWTT